MTSIANVRIKIEVVELQADICAGLPVMALTATATSSVIDDIIKSLKMPRCRRFQVLLSASISCCLNGQL